MAHITDISPAKNKGSDLRLINGTGSHQSYAVIARRGSTFLGIKFSGLLDGARMGVPGKTYLHARLRSARDDKLAAQLDLATGANNVLNLLDHQLALDEAWPNLPFEKVDGERASVLVGAFIQGWMIDDTAAVVTRIEQGDLFRKLIEYVIGQAGAVNCIVDAKTVASWLLDQAKPMLAGLKKALTHQKLVREAQKAFGAMVENQMEVVGPHLRQLNAIYQELLQA